MKTQAKKRRSFLRLLSLWKVLFLVLILIGCSLSVPLSSLYGTYVADYDVAKEKLTLNKDETFIQEVKLKATSKVDVAKGTWTYNTESGYVMLRENYMPVLNGFRKLNPDYNRHSHGPAFLPADKFFGRILLGAAEGVLYKKVE